MNGSEWLACADPVPMLEFLRGRASSRRMRLFAAACCRRIGHLLVHEASRRAVEVGERFADGRAGDDERREAQAAANAVCSYPSYDLADPGGVDSYATEAAVNVLFGDDDYLPIPTYAATCAIAAARAAADAMAFAAARASGAAGEAAELVAERAYEAECERQSDLVRDIFGGIARPAVIDSAWLTGDVVALARAIDEGRAFERMPDLGDALERAGSTDDVLLAHCRGSREHARGCWALDAVLGRD
jgi:hypothetical protein